MKKCQVRDINVVQWNARSLVKNISYLTNYLFSRNIQVLLLQSLNTTKSNIPKISGFYYPPIYDSKNDGGRIQTAIYVQEGLIYCERTSPVPKSCSSISSCAIIIKFSSSLVLNLASVYLPRGPDSTNTEWLKHFHDQRDNWIIGGDFNAHAPFWDKNCKNITSNRLIENIIDSNLYLLNNGHVTRVPDIPTHKPAAIDLTLISPSLAPNAVWQTEDDLLGSDHIPILLTLNFIAEVDAMPQDSLPKFNYKYADWAMFRAVLHNTKTDLSETMTLNDMYVDFCTSLLRAAKISVPELKASKTGQHHGNVWWNKDCEKAVNEKKEKYKQYIANRSPENHTAMKSANINCNRVIEQAKEQYWTSFCTYEVSDHKDMQKIWEKLKTMKNGIKLPSIPVKLENNPLPSSQEKAEAFADMFAEVCRVEGLPISSRNYRVKWDQVATSSSKTRKQPFT